MTTNRASASEDEYFARQEAERSRERASEIGRQTAQTDQAERDRLKVLHFMPFVQRHMARRGGA
jgi:hypothetical protein